MWRFPPPTIEQGDNNNGSNNNGNNGGGENGGGGEQENGTKELRHLFDKTFGQNTDGMYFALHITGKTAPNKINPNTKLGLFAQLSGDKSAYARDLAIQMKSESGATKYQFSASYEQMGLADIYSKKYGWTDIDGINLDMPFYFGLSQFYIPDNSLNDGLSFRSFAVQDMTVYMLDPNFDSIVFVRCNVDDFHIQIPKEELDKFNKDIHRNIALFTVEFKNTECTDYSVTFDGFVEK